MGLRIFLSAVSGQFKDCRDALASDLRAVGAEVVVQEDFQQHGRSLLEKLERYIAGCDRVIALVGDAYGWEPEPGALAPGTLRRSYTQWEYFFAQGEHLDGSRQPRKDIFVYFAAPDFLAQHSVAQAADAAQLQQDFIAAIRRSGEDRNAFGSLHELRALVLRDGFRLPPHRLQPRNLPYDSIGTLFKGRAAFLHDIHERFQREPTRAAAIVSKQAVHGLGGVGKTRLAVEYALAYEAEYSAILFVIAGTPEALHRNLAALCGPLVLNLPEQNAKEEVRVGAALRWLLDHSSWLLILDNVDTPDAAAEVECLLAQLHGGHVLITSRISDWSSGVEPLGVSRSEGGVRVCRAVAPLPAAKGYLQRPNCGLEQAGDGCHHQS